MLREWKLTCFNDIYIIKSNYKCLRALLLLENNELQADNSISASCRATSHHLLVYYFPITACHIVFAIANTCQGSHLSKYVQNMLLFVLMSYKYH